MNSKTIEGRSLVNQPLLRQKIVIIANNKSWQNIKVHDARNSAGKAFLTDFLVSGMNIITSKARRAVGSLQCQAC